jgi:protein SCO1/2
LTVVWAGDDVVLPTTSVPELALIDQDGQPFDLRTLRGTPVIVTFLYAHCQTVCPTVMRDVLRARRDAGREEVPIVVVTLDPWRDVVARLPAIAREWNFAAHDRILTGTIGDVNRTLDAWGVSRARDDRTGELAHIAVVVLVDRDGRRAYRTDGNPVRLRELLVAAL